MSKQKDIYTMISQFKVGEEYIYDTKEIYKLLIQQYNSQLSNRSKTSSIIDHEINDTELDDLADIKFNVNDITKVINKLRKN